MDDIYLVEIRLGRTKWRIKKTVFAIEQLYDIGLHIEKHPHVTLSGPLTLKEGITTAQLLGAIESIAAAFDPVPFMLDGWETRKGMSGSVIAFRVVPSDALFRQSILKRFDYCGGYRFRLLEIFLDPLSSDIWFTSKV